MVVPGLPFYGVGGGVLTGPDTDKSNIMRRACQPFFPSVLYEPSGTDSVMKKAP
jgi:hypothetical protein